MYKFPVWKYWLVIIVMVLGIVLALPNVFGEAPAIQIARKDRAPITSATVAASETAVRDILKVQSIIAEDSYLENGHLLFRFADEPTQQKARKVVLDATDDYSIAYSKVSRMPGWMRSVGVRQISFGLDLQGGVDFLYEVDVQSALRQSVERLERDLRATLRDKRIPYTTVVADKDSLRITLRTDEKLSEAIEVLKKQEEGLVITSQPSDADTGGPVIQVQLSAANIKQRQDDAIQQNITTLRNRINELGVSEPIVARQGKDRISVQLPGVKDANEAKRVLGATATLAFYMVDEANDAAQAADTKRIPLGSKLYTMRDSRRPILLKRELIVAGEQLVDANSTFSEGQPAVNVKLDARGGAEMLKNTQANLGHRMGVVYIEKKRLAEGERCNGQRVGDQCTEEGVISDARINGIFGPSFIITGLSPTESRELALLLRAGSLAAPLYTVSERTVGPSLGQDNIKKGVNALVLGMLLTFAFMAIYYRAFGWVANAVLLANVILMTALLSLLPTSLSLPGIAGLVLTVGMAVDANILIYERIREELRIGNSPQAAINTGFEKAFSTIVDANVTTLIAGVVLFAMASGPIRGFAVVLTLGIATSMFTAIIGSRALVHAIWGRRRKLERLSV
jgi:preprotein translocase subunit SecD